MVAAGRLRRAASAVDTHDIPQERGDARGAVSFPAPHLGHATPQITATTYAHEFENAARSDALRERLDSIFGSAMAAQDRSNVRDADAATGGEVVDMQGKAASAVVGRSGRPGMVRNGSPVRVRHWA